MALFVRSAARSVILLTILGGATYASSQAGVSDAGDSTDAEPPKLIHPWRLVADKHWQIIAKAGDELVPADALEGSPGACPPDAVEVAGNMKMDSAQGTVEELQESVCVQWIQREFPERCARFDADRWREVSRAFPTRPHAVLHRSLRIPQPQGRLSAYRRDVE